MGKEIINSFKEYQEKYTLLLGDFCNNQDFDEIDFITTEIDYYRIYLTSVGMYKRRRYRGIGEPHLNEDLTFLSGNGVSYDLIAEAIVNKTKSEGVNNLDNIIANYKIHFNKIISFLENKKTELETKPQTVSAPENKQKTNKSLLFKGEKLNLSERFKIANEVLGIDKKIRTLNIQDLEKYQLLAYILGCDKDNARNLMNGSYRSKDRDLLTYFNELGLNK